MEPQTHIRDREHVAGTALPEAYAHCAALVREHDPDRYIATLYAPEPQRAALSALYAFSHEVARVRALVSEPLPGEVAAGEPTARPVPAVGFLAELDQLIAHRQQHPEEEPGSYTVRLFEKGLARIAQKVGEEAVETVIDAMAGNRAGLPGEAADLLYHLLVLLRVSGSSLDELLAVLRQRHQVIKGGQRRPLPE